MSLFYKVYNRITEKTKNIDRKGIIVPLVVALVFVAIWVLFGYHISDFSKGYRNVTYNLIMAETENESSKISAGFDERFSIVQYLASILSDTDDEELEILIHTALEEAMNAGAYEELIYISTDGIVTFPDGSKSANYDTGSIISKCSLDEDYHVFPNTDNFITNAGTFGVLSVVTNNNNVKGYVCGLSRYDTLVDAASIREELIHDEVILDGDGKVVANIKTEDNVIVVEKDVNFFELAEAEMTAEDYAEFINSYNESINSDVPGKTIVKTGKEDIMFVYYPISGTHNWVIMNCYPRSVAETRMIRIRRNAILIFMVILIFMMSAFIILIRYISGERKKVSDLEYLDGLTGVCNRSAFIARASQVIKDNKGIPYNIICFDVINFRIINDTYGHERSDEIIKALAKACTESFGHNEAYGRITADVYVAAVVDDGEEDARLAYIEEFVSQKAKEVYINFPIRLKRGVYAVINDDEEIDRMIDKANIARKYVDNNSNKLVCYYTEDLMIDVRKAEQIESRMHAALAGGEFRPYFQAKYDMDNNCINGAEALVRWIKPDGTVIPPGDFIPLFEKNGFVEKIDFYMLEEVRKYIRRMIDEGREVFTVSVNQSRYLMDDPDYVSKIRTILLKYKIPVGLIELEITETVFSHERERMIKMMNDLKKINVKLSIDDFGTGYSSFNILKDVPFDILKIDRTFLSDSVYSQKGLFILKEIVEIAHGLGMSVICEGVETEEQSKLLISIGCHNAQGFLYARPIPMEEFIQRYNTLKG